jgi:soluble lytic murein transglycosylase-like protein
MINRSAEQYGVASTTLDAVLNCESMKNPDAIGDHGESRGISQINSRYHPEVTDEQAFDPEWSIDWTARRISEGEGHEWMCFRMLELSTDEDLQTL